MSATAKGKALRLTRIIVSAVMAAAVTSLALGADKGLLPTLGEWVARMQLIPAALAFAMAIFAGWIGVTLIAGRVYCSSVCPMGTFQDVIARIGRIFHRNHVYRFVPAVPLLRNAMVVATLAVAMAGIVSIVALLDPYSVYMKVAGVIGRPFARLAGAALLGAIIAAMIMGAVAAVAWRRGRRVCNTVCPVGTLLGYVSRHSLLGIDIDTDCCTRCRRCEYACKGECINIDDGTVDMSRCVVCFDCLTACRDRAIDYTVKRHRLSIPMLQRTAPPAAATSAVQGADLTEKPISQ